MLVTTTSPTVFVVYTHSLFAYLCTVCATMLEGLSSLDDRESRSSMSRKAVLLPVSAATTGRQLSLVQLIAYVASSPQVRAQARVGKLQRSMEVLVEAQKEEVYFDLMPVSIAG